MRVDNSMRTDLESGCSGNGVKAILEQVLSADSYFGRSVLRGREARNHIPSGLSQLNGFFICRSLLGAAPVSSNVDMLAAAPNREYLNPDTVSGHRLAETYAVPLWRLFNSCGLGHARKHPSYRPTVKEKVRALMFNCGSAATRNQPRVIAESESCAFLSLFTLGTTAQNVSGSQGNVPVFAWGDCFVFCFSLCFNFSCSSTVQISTEFD